MNVFRSPSARSFRVLGSELEGVNASHYHTCGRPAILPPHQSDPSAIAVHRRPLRTLYTNAPRHFDRNSSTVPSPALQHAPHTSQFALEISMASRRGGGSGSSGVFHADQPPNDHRIDGYHSEGVPADYFGNTKAYSMWEGSFLTYAKCGKGCLGGTESANTTPPPTCGNVPPTLTLAPYIVRSIKLNTLEPQQLLFSSIWPKTPFMMQKIDNGKS